MAFWDKFLKKQKEDNTFTNSTKDNSEKRYRPYFSLLTDDERIRAIKYISPITESGQFQDIQLAYGVRLENEKLVLINYRVITEKRPETGKILYHRHFIVLFGTCCCNAHYTSDNIRDEGELIYSVPDVFTKSTYAEKLFAEPLRAAMSFYRFWPMHRAFEDACKKRKPSIDVTIIIKAIRVMLFEQYENYLEEQKKEKTQSESVSQPQPAAEKPVQKKVHKGPDFVAMVNKEKEYTISLCERLAAKYGKVEFGVPATENEISCWEETNQVAIPEDLKEWLRFAGKSKFKGIPLEFYPIAQFKKEQNYVVIGKRENTPIAFETESDRYIALEGGNRKNLGHMETILRFWYYDAKELFAEEELEKLRPVIEEETLKMKQAEQKAKMSANVKDAMEYFLIKHNIGYLYKWRTFPHCSIRKDIVDCGLVISEPDRDGYYQWKPQEQTVSIDFTSIEAKLGFSVHKDIKALVSSYFYFTLGGDIDDKNFDIPPLLPITNIEKYVLDRFEKESYAGDYDFILKGHFFHLGGACIEGDDSFVLEVNNETGEVLAVEYMDKKHEKFADSLYDLFMNSNPIWYEG